MVKSRYLLILAGSACALFAGCATDPARFRLVEISPGIFEGHKPWRQTDFDALHAKGIRTILSLEQLPWDTWPEQRKARHNGFIYRDVPILASPLPPREKRVKEALLLLHDPHLRPVYIHCLLGEDRSAFIVGLYRIYFQDWTPRAAWDEMLRWGFHPALRLRGFETYFWRHSQIPEWAKKARSAKPP